MQGNHRGFTLVELMAVVAIISILVASAALNTLAILPRYQLHAAARDFAGSLRAARMGAIKSRRSVPVLMDLGTNIYSVDGHTVPHQGTLDSHYGGGVRYGFGLATRSAAAPSSRLPASPVTFQGKPKRLVFNQRGLSSSGTVYFTNRLGDCCAVVVSTSGRIRMRTWTGKNWR